MKLRWSTALLLGFLTSALVCAHGVPLLRHDWSFPVLSSALPNSVANLFEPWIGTGIGEAQPYPTFYLAGFVLWPFSFLPPSIFVAALVAALGTATAFAGMALAGAYHRTAGTQITCAVFATLNPWTYNEYVAGHVFMVLAYAVMIFLVAEMMRPAPRGAVLAVCGALLCCQLEYFVLAVIPVSIWLIRKRFFLALAALAVSIVPVAFGIVTHYDEIRATPFLLEWQKTQSVFVSQAVQLRGYFTRYDTVFSPVGILLAILAAGYAAATVMAALERAKDFALLAAGWVAIFMASGTKWILTPVYVYLVLHVTEVGLYRELYDLIAFAAIGFLIAIARLGFYKPALRLFAVCVFAVTTPWIFHPPFSWFVPERSFQASVFPPDERYRVGLFPAFQPLTLRGAGSGYDPDLNVQRGRSVPINSFLPSFPEAAALGMAAAGDDSYLTALGVRYKVVRPLLQPDVASQSHTTIPIAHNKAPSGEVQLRGQYPVLGFVPKMPPLVGVGNDVRATAIFYADDATRSSEFFPQPAPRLSPNSKSDWVDARLASASYPQIATRFEGAFTESAAPLPWSGRPFVLAWTDGTMVNDRGLVVARAHSQLRWWRVPAGTASLRCHGACAVTGSSTAEPPSVLQGNAVAPVPLAMVAITPWMFRFEMPAHAAGTLRYAERFSAGWNLWGAGARHVRLNQDLNGWILPAASANDSLIGINILSATQFVLEICSAAAVMALIAFAFATDRKRVSQG